MLGGGQNDTHQDTPRSCAAAARTAGAASGPTGRAAGAAASATSPPTGHLGPQSCDDASSELSQTTCRAASRNPAESRECLKRHWPSPPRTRHLGARRPRRAGPVPPHAGHLGARNCEDIADGTNQTTSRSTFPSPELRGCLERNWPHHLRSGHLRTEIWEVSPTKLAILNIRRSLSAPAPWPQRASDTTGPQSGRKISRQSNLTAMCRRISGSIPLKIQMRVQL